MQLVNTISWNDGEEEMIYTYKVSSLSLQEKESENLNINTHPLTHSKTRIKKITRELGTAREWMRFNYF